MRKPTREKEWGWHIGLEPEGGSGSMFYPIYRTLCKDLIEIYRANKE